MVSGDWWFLAAATPLSLVSPPATSSRQHVLASARPATPSARASPLALNKQTRDTEKEAAGDGRVQQYKRALLATADSLPPCLSDASSHSVL